MAFLSDPGKHPAQLLFDLVVPQSRSPFLGHDDQVDGGQFGFVAAKKFPEQTFNAIAPYRVPQAPGDHQSQPGTGGGHGSQDQTEMAGMEPLALGLRPQEVLTMAEPLRLTETGVSSKVGVRTGAEHRRLVSGMRPRGSPPLRRSGVYGLWPGGVLKPGGRPGCSSALKIHGCGPGANYSVEMCVSFSHP
jgi:hypothetical protein